jgi:hypothetical protein
MMETVSVRQHAVNCVPFRQDVNRVTSVACRLCVKGSCRMELSLLKLFMGFLNPSRKIPEQYLDYVMIASFQILSNSSVIPPIDAM